MFTALLLLSACAPTGPDREGWLIDTLTDDNLVWLSREPELLAHKYQAMAAHPYPFMRGTLGVFWRDLARTGAARAPTALLDDPALTQVLLLGDPHPENFGSFLPGAPPALNPGEPLLLEVNDLDGATWGPFTLDLRRAALGLGTLAWGLEGTGPREVEALVDALVVGYLGGLGLEGQEGPAAALDARWGISGALLADAAEDGADRKRLEKVTELNPASGVRRLTLDAALDEEGAGMLAPTPEERAQALRLAQALAAQAPEGFRVLDVARRYGSGIASRPAVRYVVLWDLGAAGDEDDDLLQLREVVDPPSPPTAGPARVGAFPDNAARVVQAARWAWSRPDADPLLGGACDGAQCFKALSWSSYYQSIEREDLEERWEEGELGLAELEQLAWEIGLRIAQAHLQAPGADGGDSAPALQAALAGRTQVLHEELQAQAQADLDRLLLDHALFGGALERWGPLLGAERLVAP